MISVTSVRRKQSHLKNNDEEERKLRPRKTSKHAAGGSKMATKEGIPGHSIAQRVGKRKQGKATKSFAGEKQGENTRTLAFGKSARKIPKKCISYLDIVMQRMKKMLLTLYQAQKRSFRMP